MSEINAKKFENIFQILSEYNFEKEENIPTYLTCIKCNKILNDACQSPCGCRICRGCIDLMLTDGSQVCPGNSEDCKEETLTNFVKDYRANKEISNLVVQCPEESCQHKCEIRNMHTHLKYCPKKSINCPFFCFGCEDDTFSPDRFADHINSNSFSHNQMLIDVINNTRKELDILKKSEEKKQIDIKSLKEISVVKDETFNTINEEIVAIKLENKTRVQHVEIQVENLEKKINEILLEAHVRCKLEKLESAEDTGRLMQMKHMKGNMDDSFSEMAGQIETTAIELRNEMNENINRINKELQKFKIECEIQMNDALDGLEKKLNGTFVWNIENLSGRRDKYESIYSEYFYLQLASCKMQLALWNNVDGTSLRIRLHIYLDESGTSLKYPFKADVTVKIYNKASPDTYKRITKYCKIEKPANNSYKYCDPFDFSYSDLCTSDNLKETCFTVECFVNRK